MKRSFPVYGFTGLYHNAAIRDNQAYFRNQLLKQF